MKFVSKEEKLILDYGGEIVGIDFNAEPYMPMVEFLYDGWFVSIGEDENLDWEIHYGKSDSYFDGEIKIEFADYDIDLITIIQTYIDYIGLANLEELWDEEYYQYGELYKLQVGELYTPNEENWVGC